MAAPITKLIVSSVEDSVAQTREEEVATGDSIALVEAAISPEPEGKKKGKQYSQGGKEIRSLEILNQD